MFTEDKVTEIFCMADDFCEFFERMIEKYTFHTTSKRKYHRNNRMSKSEIMVIIMLCSRIIIASLYIFEISFKSFIPAFMIYINV